MKLASKLNVITALGLILSLVPPSPASAAGFERLGEVHTPTLTELSGLAASRRQPGAWWAINDSGNASQLVAVNDLLEVAAVVEVEDAINHDWEDLAAFELEGRPYLLIADTGDNFGLRAEASLILVPEPALADKTVKVERVIRFHFEGGPRDCEAVAVDAPGRRVLLADKGRHPAGLYELPLDGDASLRVARRIGEFPALVSTPPPRVSTLDGAQGRGTPTSMSVSADGRRLAVLTYLSLSVFERADDQDWRAALARPVSNQRLPRVSGFEALGLAADGESAWIGTEGVRAQIYRWTPTR